MTLNPVGMDQLDPTRLLELTTELGKSQWRVQPAMDTVAKLRNLNIDLPEQILEIATTYDVTIQYLGAAFVAAREDGPIKEELRLNIEGMSLDAQTIYGNPSIDALKNLKHYDTILKIKSEAEKASPPLKSETKKAKLDLDDQPSTSKNKRSRTESCSSVISNISTSNRFAVLDLNDNPEMEVNSGPQCEESDPNIPKPPRIESFFIDFKNKNWRTFIKELNDVTTLGINAKLNGEFLKVTPKSVEDFRTLQRHLINSKTKFHALNLKMDRPKKVLIKGLPADTNVDELKGDLAAMGYEIQRITQLLNRKSKAKLPVFLVYLAPTEGWKEIFNIFEIGYLRVRVDSFKSTGFKQCYNCQGFNHSSDRCTLTPRCVRCAGTHHTRDPTCPMRDDVNRTIPAKCVNCAGDHPANFIKCPKNPRNKNSKQNETIETTNKAQENNKQSASQSALSFIPRPLHGIIKSNAWEKIKSTNAAAQSSQIPPEISNKSVSKQPSTSSGISDYDNSFPPLPNQKTNSHPREQEMATIPPPASETSNNLNLKTPTAIGEASSLAPIVDLIKVVKDIFGSVGGLTEIKKLLLEITNILKSKDDILTKCFNILVVIEPLLPSENPARHG